MSLSKRGTHFDGRNVLFNSMHAFFGQQNAALLPRYYTPMPQSVVRMDAERFAQEDVKRKYSRNSM